MKDQFLDILKSLDSSWEVIRRISLFSDTFFLQGAGSDQSRYFSFGEADLQLGKSSRNKPFQKILMLDLKSFSLWKILFNLMKHGGIFAVIRTIPMAAMLGIETHVWFQTIA